MWDDFSSFTFGEDGIEIAFAPYHVSAYAYGPQFVTLPYEAVAKLMRKSMAYALGIEHMQHDYPKFISEF